MSLWTCFKWLTEIGVVVLLASHCILGKAGACPSQHPTNPNPCAVKCLLFGKHPLDDATDAPLVLLQTISRPVQLQTRQI